MCVMTGLLVLTGAILTAAMVLRHSAHLEQDVVHVNGRAFHVAPEGGGGCAGRRPPPGSGPWVDSAVRWRARTITQPRPVEETRTSGPTPPSTRRRGRGRDRSDNLTLLKCHRRLPDDPFVPLQPGLDVERVAEVEHVVIDAELIGITLSRVSRPSITAT